MSQLPYIVTTKRPNECTCGLSESERCYADTPFVSRRAVATLEEARRAAVEAVLGEKVAALYGQRHGDTAYDAACTIPESGGTVGPLPDGTVIEVERWSDLQVTAWLLEHGFFDYPPITDRERYAPFFCDAFNARQS